MCDFVNGMLHCDFTTRVYHYTSGMEVHYTPLGHLTNMYCQARRYHTLVGWSTSAPLSRSRVTIAIVIGNKHTKLSIHPTYDKSWWQY